MLEVLNVSIRNWVQLEAEQNVSGPLMEEAFPDFVTRVTTPCEKLLLGQLDFPLQGLHGLTTAL